MEAVSASLRLNMHDGACASLVNRASTTSAYRTGWLMGNSASELSYLTDASMAELRAHGHVHH